MQKIDSDSSDADSSTYTTTNVLLGYASKEPTYDAFSQLGGRPTWPSPTSLPSSTLARCKTCNGMMTFLLQLYADLPSHFPGHERRLYVFSCKRKACRRKDGSMRVLRGTKTVAKTQQEKDEASVEAQHKMDERRRREQGEEPVQTSTETQPRLGDSIFNSSFTPTSEAGQNPFVRLQKQEPERPLNDHYHRPLANPFAPSSSGNPIFKPLASAAPSANGSFPDQQAPPPPTSQSDPQTLATTFAAKARISPSTPSPKTPWPQETSLPPPYPTYHLDAGYETLDPTPPASSSAAKTATLEIDPVDPSNPGFDKDAFESALDATFQKFADRLAQNPEQVLRYEFGGQPLLYSSADAVGRMLHGDGPRHHDDGKVRVRMEAGKGRRMPNCENCGAERVFEMQLVPEAIAVLESEEVGVDGMEWGCVIVGVCERDCGGEEGWGWMEEWCGVQWEEVGGSGS